MTKHALKWRKVRPGQYVSRCEQYLIDKAYVSAHNRTLWWIYVASHDSDGTTYLEDVGGTDRLYQAKYIAWGDMLKREQVAKRSRTSVYGPKWFNPRSVASFVGAGQPANQ
jgi:hypothetical protein